MKRLSHNQIGSLFAIASGLFFGLVGYFGMSIIRANVSVPTMLFWRFLVASVILGSTLLVQRVTNQLSGQYKTNELFQVFLYGALLYTPSTCLYFTASKLIGTGLSMVIFFTFPAMILIINWILFRKPVHKSYYVALILIAIGMALLADFKNAHCDSIGIGIGLFSALIYAGYAIVSKMIKLPPMLATFMVSLGCMTTAFIFALASNSLTVPTSFPVWGNIVGIAIICSALPILFFLESLKYISTEKASILSVLEPVFVVIFGVLLLDEQVSMLQSVGIITILAGALLTLHIGE